MHYSKYILCIVITSYDNQLYNIHCGEGRLAYVNVTSLDMQGNSDCSYEQNPRYHNIHLIYRQLLSVATFTAGVRITFLLTVIWVEQQRFVAMFLLLC